MNIFGHHIKHQYVWAAAGIGGLIALVLYLRARASAQAADTAAAAPQPDQGAGMTVAAPTPGVADQYQNDLNNSQLQAQNLANAYQQNLITQQQKQFDLQQSIAEQLAPDVVKQQRAALAVQTHYDTAASKAPVSCPGNASLRTAPDGSLYCREKTSGVPIITPIIRTAENLVYGAEQAAPSIGYQMAQQAAQDYSRKVFTQNNSEGGGNYGDYGASTDVAAPSVSPVAYGPKQPAQPFYPTPTGAPITSIGHDVGHGY